MLLLVEHYPVHPNVLCKHVGLVDLVVAEDVAALGCSSGVPRDHELILFWLVLDLVQKLHLVWIQYELLLALSQLVFVSLNVSIRYNLGLRVGIRQFLLLGLEFLLQV